MGRVPPLLIDQDGLLRLFRDEEGQSLIMVAVALPCLIAFIGLAVDVGILFTAGDSSRPLPTPLPSQAHST